MVELEKLREFMKVYQGIGSKSCANFVSKGLINAGAKIPVCNVTTDLFEYTDYIGNSRYMGVQLGDIVFWDFTYDALPPDGIGPEDTYTHVGICLDNYNVVHYSSSLGYSVETKFTDLGFVIHEFRRVKSNLWPEGSFDILNGKLFFHDGLMSFVDNIGIKWDVISVSGNEIKYRRGK